MRLRKYNKSFGMLSLFAAATVLSGCDMALMAPKGQIGLEQRSLILTALGLMLIVVIPVIVMAILFAWRYRSSNTKATYLPEWAHSNKIEAVVWTVPIIIVITLATITWKTTHALDPFKPIPTDGKPIPVEVIALDWKWLFIYPEQGIATVNELAFPAHVPVEFKITSDTVMNSFFIPRLGGQIYAMAGMQTKLHLVANEPGKFNGISSSYSGAGFSGMKFTAIATDTPEAFEQWVEKVRQSPKKLDTTEAFNQLAQQSEFHPVEYFSTVKPDLFRETIVKFLGEKRMASMQHEHAGMNMQHEHAHTDVDMNADQHSSHSGE